MIVVSDIGEQWSPHTDPARQADIEITSISDSSGKTAHTIGIRILNVPQLVPVEKARNTDTANITAGIKSSNKNPDKKGTVDFLCYQSKDYGDNGWSQ